MRKTPRGWIQIGEPRTRGVARIPLGLKPSRDSRATSQRDSPIWIQPLGVFRYIINHEGYFGSHLTVTKYSKAQTVCKILDAYFSRDIPTVGKFCCRSTYLSYVQVTYQWDICTEINSVRVTAWHPDIDEFRECVHVLWIWKFRSHSIISKTQFETTVLCRA